MVGHGADTQVEGRVGHRHVFHITLGQRDLDALDAAELGLKLLQHALRRINAGDAGGTEAVDQRLRGPPGAAPEVDDVVVLPGRDRHDQPLRAADVEAHRVVVVGGGVGEALGDEVRLAAAHGRPPGG